MPPQVTCNARGGQNRNNFRCKTQLFNRSHTRIHKALLVDACAEVHATGFYGYWLLKEDAAAPSSHAARLSLEIVQCAIFNCPMSNVHCAIFSVQRPMCYLHCAGSWVERGWTFEQKSETMVCSSLPACGLTFELNNPRGVAPLWQAVSSKYYPFPLSSVRPVWRWDENGGKWAKALKCECV